VPARSRASAVRPSKPRRPTRPPTVAARLRPRPAADARPPPVSSPTFLPQPPSRSSRGRNRARSTRVVGAPPPRAPAPSASLKGSRAPLARPPAAPAPFSPSPGRNCRTEEPRRPPSSPSASPSSPSRHRLRFSPVVSSPWSPLSPHAFLFEFRGFLAPFPQASASSMPPAMAPAPGLPLRPSSRRGREPPYPPISRVSSVAIFVDRRLLTARASELHAAGHGLPRRSHCSGRPKPPRLIRTVHRAINGRK